MGWYPEAEDDYAPVIAAGVRVVYANKDRDWVWLSGLEGIVRSITNGGQSAEVIFDMSPMQFIRAKGGSVPPQCGAGTIAGTRWLTNVRNLEVIQ